MRVCDSRLRQAQRRQRPAPLLAGCRQASCFPCPKLEYRRRSAKVCVPVARSGSELGGDGGLRCGGGLPAGGRPQVRQQRGSIRQHAQQRIGALEAEGSSLCLMSADVSEVFPGSGLSASSPAASLQHPQQRAGALQTAHLKSAHLSEVWHLGCGANAHGGPRRAQQIATTSAVPFATPLCNLVSGAPQRHSGRRAARL